MSAELCELGRRLGAQASPLPEKSAGALAKTLGALGLGGVAAGSGYAASKAYGQARNDPAAMRAGAGATGDAANSLEPYKTPAIAIGSTLLSLPLINYLLSKKKKPNSLDEIE